MVDNADMGKKSTWTALYLSLMSLSFPLYVKLLTVKDLSLFISVSSVFLHDKKVNVN